MKDLSYRKMPEVAALPSPTVDLAGVLVVLSADQHVYACDGSNWLDLTLNARSVSARLASDVTNSTTALANVTGLVLALAANSTYQVNAQLMFQSTATTNGIRLSQTVPTGATVVAQWNTPTSLTATTVANQRSADGGAASTSIDTANVNTLATASILVVTGASSGNLQIRFASELGTASVIAKAGSNLVAVKV